MRGTSTAFDIETGIMHTLNYFNVFHYPLKKEELLRFNSFKMTNAEMEEGLLKLIGTGKIVQDDDLYALASSPDNFSRRRSSNELAAELLPKAQRIGHFLSRFPFVRFVGISGSLSKQYADENTDFDFFIICSKNRLWIARTLMHIFKKLSFIANKQKYFCMNYYLSEDQLKIEDSNKYTAIELATLIPVVNQDLYDNLLMRNQWLSHFVPNFIPFQKAKYPLKKGILKRSIETLFNVLFAERLNRALMRLTDAKWRAKWKKYGYSSEEYELAFRTKIHVSKNHPKNFQKLVLKREKLGLNNLLSPSK